RSARIDADLAQLELGRQRAVRADEVDREHLFFTTRRLAERRDDRDVRVHAIVDEGVRRTQGVVRALAAVGGVVESDERLVLSPLRAALPNPDDGGHLEDLGVLVAVAGGTKEVLVHLGVELDRLRALLEQVDDGRAEQTKRLDDEALVERRWAVEREQELELLAAERWDAVEPGDVEEQELRGLAEVLLQITIALVGEDGPRDQSLIACEPYRLDDIATEF